MAVIILDAFIKKILVKNQPIVTYHRHHPDKQLYSHLVTQKLKLEFPMLIIDVFRQLLRLRETFH